MTFYKLTGIILFEIKRIILINNLTNKHVPLKTISKLKAKLFILFTGHRQKLYWNKITTGAHN